MQGKILKGIAGFYYVHVAESGVYECKAKGVFRQQKIKPLVGDIVDIAVIDEEEKTGNVEKILPRKNELFRPAVANIDMALLIFAAANPQPNLNLLDRFLIFMQMQQIPVTICFNKMELLEPKKREELAQIYKGCGCPVLFTSAKEQEGIEQLRLALHGIKGYGRYMDDGYLIHEDIKYLEYCLKRIDEVCAELGITLNRKKTRIIPIQKGITFLKTKFILTDTGRVVRKMSRPSIRAMKRKLFIFRKWVDSGKFTLEDVRTAYESWRGHMRRGDSYFAVARVDEYFKRLFGFHPNDKIKYRRQSLCI